METLRSIGLVADQASIAGSTQASSKIEQFGLCVMLRILFCQFPGAVAIDRTVKNLPSRATYHLRIRTRLPW
jgi:hypothetical protein